MIHGDKDSAPNAHAQADGAPANTQLEHTGTPVLDAHQLKRIEAVHNGFLYQHLYAVGCLLSAQNCGATSIKVERDEDVEVSLEAEQVYIQVKTRSRHLIASDIQSALNRFSELRSAHASGGQRSGLGSASFYIISNVEPGPALAADLRAAEWPSDVNICWPGRESRRHPSLPPAWTDAPQALGWCTSRARTIPFSSLLPETLVWKLAGCIISACAGTPPRADHAFAATELPDLFEQLVVQMQRFPAVPEHYRPQIDEPDLSTAARVRIISGFSGAGKTAWASQAALHTPSTAIYFDTANVPGPAIAGGLAREVAARFITSSGRLGAILLPGISGLDALRLLDQHLVRNAMEVTVVCDNAHEAPTDALRAMVTATKAFRFVFLCQPRASTDSLAALLGTKQEYLRGWSADSVAEEVVRLEVKADFPTCQRIVETTGGLPLYVQSALQLARAQYDGDTHALCEALTTNSNVAETAQETILSGFYDSLPANDRGILSMLSEIECPLKHSEAAAIAQRSLEVTPASFFSALRRLVAGGAVQAFGQQRIKVHDAIRVLGRAHLPDLGESRVMALRVALRDVLKQSLLAERDLTRLAPLVRLLGLTGDVDTLIDLANDEMFHEMGLAPDFRLTLDDAARSEALAPQQRFWALDALAFAELQSNDLPLIPKRLEEMAALVANHKFGYREQVATASKKMLYQAKTGGGDSLQQAIQGIEALTQHDPDALRFHKYNAACASYYTDDISTARTICNALIDEYMALLGITPSDIFAKNPDQIWPLLKNTAAVGDNLKRLADCMDLDSRCSIKRREHPGLRRIHAFKFYTMANAFSSATKVGEDYVADCLEFNDPITARRFIEETLLPGVYKIKLMNRVVPIRGLYALTLAYCGDFDAADGEMSRASAFEESLSEADKRDMAVRRETIVDLRRANAARPAGPITPRTINRSLSYVDDSAIPRLPGKVGRNAPCPCGSGVKFKRCHALRR